MSRLVAVLFFVIVFAASAYAKLKVPGSLTAHFVQTASGGGHIMQASGKVAINRSRAFSADYRLGSSRFKVCNYKSDVRAINYTSKVVIKYNVGGLLDLMQILKVAEHYKGNIYKSRYHGFRFRLWVNTKEEVYKMTFRDKQGMSNTIRFSSIRYNQKPLPSSKFRCMAPRSYRVIRGKI